MAGTLSSCHNIMFSLLSPLPPPSFFFMRDSFAHDSGGTAATVKVLDQMHFFGGWDEQGQAFGGCAGCRFPFFFSYCYSFSFPPFSSFFFSILFYSFLHFDET